MSDLCNTLGEPINTGKNGELLQKARDLVTAYNGKANELTLIVEQLLELRKQMNDACGAGGAVVSSDGWQGNALEVIPKLKMFDNDWPVRSLKTGDVTVPKIQGKNQFLDNRPYNTKHFLNADNSDNAFAESKQTASNTANAAETLAKKAVEYQYSQMQLGKTISMTDAVSYVKNSSFSEKASVQSGGMAPANSKINNDIVTAAAMADILAGDAVALQKREKESGRTMSMTDAVARIKTDRGLLNVPATALYTFTK
jgi:hypothetical protein